MRVLYFWGPRAFQMIWVWDCPCHHVVACRLNDICWTEWSDLVFPSSIHDLHCEMHWENKRSCTVPCSWLQKQGYMKVFKELNCAVGIFRGHWVFTYLWSSLTALKCVCKNYSHWQLVMLLGKKNKVTNISGAPKLLLLRLIETIK